MHFKSIRNTVVLRETIMSQWILRTYYIFMKQLYQYTYITCTSQINSKYCSIIREAINETMNNEMK